MHVRVLAGTCKGTPDGQKVGEVKEGITFHQQMKRECLKGVD